jgi:hypothetical protein
MTPALAPVTAIVPCFRCTGTLERAVASVAAQTWRPAELVLVDDGSGDETLGGHAFLAIALRGLGACAGVAGECGRRRCAQCGLANSQHRH